MIYKKCNIVILDYNSAILIYQNTIREAFELCCRLAANTKRSSSLCSSELRSLRSLRKIAPPIGGASPKTRLSFNLYEPFNSLFLEARESQKCLKNQIVIMKSRRESTLRPSDERKDSNFEHGKLTVTKQIESHDISSSFAYLQSLQTYMSNSPNGQRAVIYLKFYKLMKTLLLPLLKL